MKPLEPENDCEFPVPVEEPSLPNTYIPVPISMTPVEVTEDVVKIMAKEVELLVKEKNAEYESTQLNINQRNALRKKAFSDSLRKKVEKVENEPSPVIAPIAVTSQSTTTVTGQNTTTVTVEGGVKTTVTTPINLSSAASNSLTDLLARSKLLLASLAAK
jgi:hypothetical protein